MSSQLTKDLMQSAFLKQIDCQIHEDVMWLFSQLEFFMQSQDPKQPHQQALIDEIDRLRLTIPAKRLTTELINSAFVEDALTEDDALSSVLEPDQR